MQYLSVYEASNIFPSNTLVRDAHNLFNVEHLAQDEPYDAAAAAAAAGMLPGEEAAACLLARLPACLLARLRQFVPQDSYRHSYKDFEAVSRAQADIISRISFWQTQEHPGRRWRTHSKTLGTHLFLGWVGGRPTKSVQVKAVRFTSFLPTHPYLQQSCHS